MNLLTEVVWAVDLFPLPGHSHFHYQHFSKLTYDTNAFDHPTELQASLPSHTIKLKFDYNLRKKGQTGFTKKIESKRNAEKKINPSISSTILSVNSTVARLNEIYIPFGLRA